MTKETYEKARELFEDIELMSCQIEEVEKQHHWITVITPKDKEVYYSYRFQRELIEWLKSKKEEYQKEFDGLQ